MSNQLFSNFDTSKIFVWDNRYQSEQVTNSGYATVNLAKGTVMARYSGTTDLVVFDSTDVKAQDIVGILSDDHEILAGDTVDVNICVAGDVVQNKLVFANGTDTLDTIVSKFALPVKDVIQGDTVGIKLVASDELTETDNQ